MTIGSRGFNRLVAQAPGPKISENVNYTQRGTMEGPKAPSEARRREAPECRGGGVWAEGRRSPSPVWGSGGIAPRKF